VIPPRRGAGPRPERAEPGAEDPGQPSERRLPKTLGALGGLAFGAVVALAISLAAACHPPRFLTGPRLSGTCEGACDHYFDCRGGAQSERARTHCVADCHDVFSDEDSLRAFESLSCPDAVEYVEGARAATAGPATPGTPSNARR
jgi:hypothetical protein